MERKQSPLCAESDYAAKNAGKEQRSEIKEIVDIYRAKIINLTKETIVLEITGSPDKLDGFLDMLSDYEIVDICRTGITGIEK